LIWNASIKRARDWGHTAIAVTDHGVVQAFPEAAALGKKYGIKIIYGVEGYLVEDDDEKGQSNHIVVLAKDKVGLRHLYEIITESHLHHFYRTPRIPRGLLEAKREGLLLGSACEAGELVRALLAGKSNQEMREIASFYDYLEIQPLDNNGFLVDNGSLPDRPALMDLNRRIYQLSLDVGLPCVMTCDVHYLDPSDEIYRTVLLAGKGMADGENTAPLYYRTTNELLEEATSYLGRDAATEAVIKNPNLIANMVDELLPVPEGSYFPTLPNADKTLRDLALEGAPTALRPRSSRDRRISAAAGAQRHNRQRVLVPLCYRYSHGAKIT
jgi:DNA polymerase-3 subunit alpha (Gram-positive type)